MIPSHLVVSLYFFTINHHNKKTVKTETRPERNKIEISVGEEQKPPERNEIEISVREEQKLNEGNKTAESKRLPDVVIIGVKKSGTMTLGRTEDIYYFSVSPTQICFSDTFLKYHPNIVVQGENWFFSSDDEYRKGIPYFISSMPRARFGTK